MKIIRLPRRWSEKRWNIVAEGDIPITKHGRLQAKLLVFKSTADMNRFWMRMLNSASLGRYCRGCVNNLMHYVEDWRPGMNGKRRVDFYDARYFCVIGLCLRHLSTEAILHESVHVGFCYAKRRTKAPWAKHTDFDEEEIAYPAGLAARNIVRWMYKSGLWPEK